MKIICTQENLKNSLSVVGKTISSSNTLPILNNLLLETENGQLKISATNLEIAIITNTRCKIESSGSVTVPGKTLVDLINNLPNNNITLSTKDNNLMVESENYHTSLKTTPAEEFPLIPKIEEGIKITQKPQELKTAINQVVFAVSNNQTQPEISGILLSVEEKLLKLTATDRYRLAEKILNNPHPQTHPQQAILPQRTVLEISRIIGNQKEDVEIILSETQVAIKLGETEIISRLVDGQYPDYKQIIPTNFNTTVVMEKNALVAALRAAAVFSQNNNSVRVEFLSQKQLVVVTTEFSDLGKSSVELPAVIEGQGGGLLLNYHYLLDCLMVIDSGNLVIKMIDDNSPSLVIPEGKSDYTYLVMPIKS